jgi:hypothetical protein
VLRCIASAFALLVIRLNTSVQSCRSLLLQNSTEPGIGSNRCCRLHNDACTCKAPPLRALNDISTCVGGGASARLDSTAVSLSANLHSSPVVIRAPSNNHHSYRVNNNYEENLIYDGKESVLKEYVYMPLDPNHSRCIRLIQLYLRPGDEELARQIIHADLNDLLVCEAILEPVLADGRISLK